MLAEEVAAALGMPLLQWHIKSTTKAQQGLYEVRRGVAPAIPSSATTACTTSATTSSRACCGEAFESDQQVVLLIDEIDKADIEFPMTCCASSTAWSSTSTRRASWCAPGSARW